MNSKIVEEIATKCPKSLKGLGNYYNGVLGKDNIQGTPQEVQTLKENMQLIKDNSDLMAKILLSSQTPTPIVIELLDSYDIYVASECDDRFNFSYKIYFGSAVWESKRYLKNRITPWEEALPKAFEILEKQL
jgi:hypothetical protein